MHSSPSLGRGLSWVCLLDSQTSRVKNLIHMGIYSWCLWKGLFATLFRNAEDSGALALTAAVRSVPD